MAKEKQSGKALEPRVPFRDKPLKITSLVEKVAWFDALGKTSKEIGEMAGCNAEYVRVLRMHPDYRALLGTFVGDEAPAAMKLLWAKSLAAAERAIETLVAQLDETIEVDGIQMPQMATRQGAADKILAHLGRLAQAHARATGGGDGGNVPRGAAIVNVNLIRAEDGSVRPVIEGVVAEVEEDDDG